MPYNLTAVGNFNSTTQFMQNINTHIMEGWLGILLVAMITVILFLAFLFKTHQPTKSFAATCFIGFIMALFFYLMELVPVLMIWIYLVGAGLSVAFWNTD